MSNDDTHAATPASEDDRTRKQWRGAFYGLAGLFLVVSAVTTGEALFYPKTDDAGMERIKVEQAENAEERALLAQAVEARAAVERQKGIHCLSAWNGSNSSTVDQVKSGLLDPDSFEHLETTIYGNDAGGHGLWMDYRARSEDGGMYVARIHARVDHESCEARILAGGLGSG
ncbi:hypothetical protein [Roseibium sp.]|uniref:hypothetical protein n=1 Tax=Roseibium sp. TaxID=1936156 RepID=UPI003299A964